MKNRDFKRLLNKQEPEQILERYMLSKIYLTEKQLEKVCSIGNHHAGCCFGKGKKYKRVG